MNQMSAVNAREKFLAVMRFDTSVSPPLYEMGYWVGTIARWYEEGLPKIQELPDKVPLGDSLPGLLLGGDRRTAVANVPEKVVNLDKGVKRFPVENWIFPESKPRILEKIGDRLIVVDGMGIKKKTCVIRLVL